MLPICRGLHDSVSQPPEGGERGRVEIDNNTVGRKLEAEIETMNSNWKGLTRTELDGECLWATYAPTRRVTGVGK